MKKFSEFIAEKKWGDIHKTSVNWVPFASDRDPEDDLDGREDFASAINDLARVGAVWGYTKKGDQITVSYLKKDKKNVEDIAKSYGLDIR